MKENLEALIASIGCLPILAVGLFITGAFIGEIITVNLPTPPPWSFVFIVLLPIFAALYLSAYRKYYNTRHWLDAWRDLGRARVVGQRGRVAPPTVEEAWLASHVPRSLRSRFINNPTVWGWAALVSFLVLAYIFIWLGLLAAQR